MAALLLIKASVLLAITLGAARLLRRTPAATRHGLWSLGFAALLALPLLAYWLPVLPVPVPAAWREATTSAVAPQGLDPASLTEPNAAASVPIASPSASALSPRSTALTGSDSGLAFNAASFLIGTWAFGSFAAVAALLLSLLRVHRLARTATVLADEGWRAAAENARQRLGFSRRVRLVLSDRVRTPMAGGLMRPTIFLPSSAPAWTAERRDVVLVHELAHLAGADPLRHVAARLAVALYWFHPLAWLAAREASVAREQACDETVLALGTRPSSYAQVLLDFAESAHAQPTAALPIVERSLLERRLMAILADQPNRSVRPRPFLLFTAVAVLATVVAAARPAGHAPLPDVLEVSDGPAVTGPALPVAAAPPQRTAGGTTCWRPGDEPFNGSISQGSRDGRGIYDVIGTRGSDLIIMRTFGDLEVCMLAEGLAGADPALRPSDWTNRARRVRIESSRGGILQRLETTRGDGGHQVTWTVGGTARPFDAAGQAWRERIVEVLDSSWEIFRVRGEVSSLHGEISTLHGQESTLRGEISTLQGQVSSMRGDISSIRGDESSLRGQISSIAGELSALQGAISSEQGSISSLSAQRFGASDAEQKRIAQAMERHEAEITRLQKKIREFNAGAQIAEVERKITALEVEHKAAEIEKQIRAVDLETKSAALERRIAELDVAKHNEATMRKIAALDADKRVRELEERLAAQLRLLQDALARVR